MGSRRACRGRGARSGNSRRAMKTEEKVSGNLRFGAGAFRDATRVTDVPEGAPIPFDLDGIGVTLITHGAAFHRTHGALPAHHTSRSPPLRPEGLYRPLRDSLHFSFLVAAGVSRVACVRPVSEVATGFERVWLACAVREDFPLARACACAVRRGVRAVWERPSTAPRPVSEFLHFFCRSPTRYFSRWNRGQIRAPATRTKNPTAVWQFRPIPHRQSGEVSRSKCGERKNLRQNALQSLTRIAVPIAQPLDWVWCDPSFSEKGAVGGHVPALRS